MEYTNKDNKEYADEIDIKSFLRESIVDDLKPPISSNSFIPATPDPNIKINELGVRNRACVLVFGRVYAIVCACACALYAFVCARACACAFVWLLRGYVYGAYRSPSVWYPEQRVESQCRANNEGQCGYNIGAV